MIPILAHKDQCLYNRVQEGMVLIGNTEEISSRNLAGGGREITF